MLKPAPLPPRVLDRVRDAPNTPPRNFRLSLTWSAYLEVGVALLKKDIHDVQLVDVAVPLELLPDTSADVRDRERD